MGFLSALKSRFFPPKLVRIARKGNTSATAGCLAGSSIVVVGADLGDSTPLQPDESSVAAIVSIAAEKKSFEGNIHKYEIEGESFLPVFTDTSEAESFCGAYCSLLGRIHAFRKFSIPGCYVSSWIDEQDIIVINPQSESEVEVDRKQSQAIRECLPAFDSFEETEFLTVVLPLAGVTRPLEFRPNG